MSIVEVKDIEIQKSQKQPFFELVPGQFVDLQINNPVKFRIKARLVGYELGCYIILKHPEPLQMQNFSDVFAEGNGVIARYILEGEKGQCFAFKSTIQQVTQLPEKFIFLNYPKRIENRELRTQQRIATHLPASILSISDNGEASKNKIKGIVADISSKGCGFIFKTDNEKLKVNKMPVFVVFQMAGEKALNIPATVCNSRNEAGKVNVGIKFEDADKQVQVLLEYLFIEDF